MARPAPLGNGHQRLDRWRNVTRQRHVGGARRDVVGLVDKWSCIVDASIIGVNHLGCRSLKHIVQSRIHDKRVVLARVHVHESQLLKQTL